MSVSSPSVDSIGDSRVVVAIVSTDEASNLIGCLKSLTDSTHRNFRVIICENGGPPAFERTVAAFVREGFNECAAAEDPGNVRWAHAYRIFRFAPDLEAIVLRAPSNLGYAGGVNACIGAAGETWDAIWVLNPDTFPAPAALSALIRHQWEGDYGIVGSRLVFVSNGLVQTRGGIEWIRWLSWGRYIGFMESQSADANVAQVEQRIGFVSGASMYVTRAYIEAVGVMDDDLFVFCEDTDWCLRRGKFKLGYAHDSVVRHVHGSASGSSAKKEKRSRFNIYLTERNRVLLARKLYRAWWMFFAAMTLLQMVEYIVRARSFAQLRIALEGWSAGVKGSVGPPYFLQPRQD